MKRSIPETALGALVVFVAAGFLAYGFKAADVGNGGESYEITADFASVGGLKAGDNVQVSGVKVGTVSNVELLPDTFLARVHLDIRKNYEFPTDTAALISSESLLGGLYLALEPGAEDDMIPSGGKIQFTQAPKNLEQLLGDFIFSMKDGKEEKAQEGEKTETAQAGNDQN